MNAPQLALEIVQGGVPVGRVSLPMSALDRPVTIGAAGDIRVQGLLPQHVQLRAGPVGGILIASVNAAAPASAHGRPLPLSFTPLRLPVQVHLGNMTIEFTLESDRALRPAPPPPQAYAPHQVPLQYAPRPQHYALPPQAQQHQAQAPQQLPHAEPRPQFGHPRPNVAPMSDEATGMVSLEQLRAVAAARKRPTLPSTDSASGVVSDMPIHGIGRHVPNGQNAQPGPHASAPKASEAPKTIHGRLVHDWKRTSYLMKGLTAVLPVLGVLLVSGTSQATNASGEAEQPGESMMARAEGAAGAIGAQIGGLSSPGSTTNIDNIPNVAPVAIQEDPMQKLTMSVHSVVPRTVAERAMHKQTMVALMQGDYDTAMKLANQLAAAHPESPTYYDVMRVIYSKSKTSGRR